MPSKGYLCEQRRAHWRATRELRSPKYIAGLKAYLEEPPLEPADLRSVDENDPPGRLPNTKERSVLGLVRADD